MNKAIRKNMLLAVCLLCAMVQTTWAQTATPSTDLELYITALDNRKIYKFNYPSTSVTGEPVVLSSLLGCWAPATPPEGAAIESVHMYSHYTVTANSQCPTSATSTTADLVVLSILFEGSAYDEKEPFKTVAKRSIVIMPDYEGYGVSKDRTHPYLIQKITAKQVVDAVTYGLELYKKLNGADNTLPLKDDWRSFSIGYSQGGAVALAVQRYIEQNNLSDKLHFRGTLCGDGPYDLYRIDNTFSSSDHLSAGTTFLMKLSLDFIGNFAWIDASRPTGIRTVADVRNMKDDAWYDLSGRKLNGKPTRKGVYVYQGKKVVVGYK